MFGATGISVLLDARRANSCGRLDSIHNGLQSGTDVDAKRTGDILHHPVSSAGALYRAFGGIPGFRDRWRIYTSNTTVAFFVSDASAVRRAHQAAAQRSHL